MSDYAYEGVRRVAYESGATFVPVCPKCGRFVRADKEILITEGGHGTLADGPNGTCAKCGRVEMLFEGFM